MDLTIILHPLAAKRMAAKTTRRKKWVMNMKAETMTMKTPLVGLEDLEDHRTAFQLH
jgi:hypothetical protein